MRRRIAKFLSIAAITASSLSPAYAEGPDTSRTISIGGSVTEIIFALGKGDQLVARDTTSVYPAEVTALPDVGYMRALSSEGVLSVSPTLIVSDEGAGPAETLEVLKAANIPFVTVPLAFDGAGAAANIRIIGDAVGASGKADVLASKVEADVEAAHQLAIEAADGSPKSVMFILSAQGGRIMAAGKNTGADAMISLAGGVNAVTGFDGYKQMTDEAVTNAAPDVILVLDRGGNHAITNELLLSLPAVLPTPAAENQAILRMNGLYLLGFGPRTAEAITDLNQALYGQ